MYLNQLNYWRVIITPVVLIRLIMPPTLLEHQQKCSARVFTQPPLGSCQNPIEMSEQFVLSHANLLYLSGMYYRGNV